MLLSISFLSSSKGSKLELRVPKLGGRATFCDQGPFRFDGRERPRNGLSSRGSILVAECSCGWEEEEEEEVEEEVVAKMHGKG